MGTWGKQMDFISKNVLRGAGFLVAAQIFLTLGLTGADLADKVIQAGKMAMLPIPFLALGAFLTSENGLRAAGFTVLLWAGAGATVFFGSVYGDPDVDGIPYVTIPQANEISLGFGLANLAAVLLAGFLIWLWGMKSEAAPGTYYGVG